MPRRGVSPSRPVTDPVEKHFGSYVKAQSFAMNMTQYVAAGSPYKMRTIGGTPVDKVYEQAKQLLYDALATTLPPNDVEPTLRQARLKLNAVPPEHRNCAHYKAMCNELLAEYASGPIDPARLEQARAQIAVPVAEEVTEAGPTWKRWCFDVLTSPFQVAWDRFKTALCTGAGALISYLVADQICELDSPITLPAPGAQFIERVCNMTMQSED